MMRKLMQDGLANLCNKPVRINVEVDGALELAAVLPPHVAKGIEVGSVVRVTLEAGTPAELDAFRASMLPEKSATDFKGSSA